MTFLITILIVVIFCNCCKSINPFYLFFLPVGDGQLETTEKHEAEQFKRVFEHVRSSGESTLASAGDVESRLSSRLSELMPADYNPGFAFVVVQKRINTRIVTVNKRMPRVRKKKKVLTMNFLKFCCNMMRVFFFCSARVC